MQGYSTIVSEMWSQISMKLAKNMGSAGHPQENMFTHVFLQAGVGSFAGGIAAALVNNVKEGCPFLSVLPKIVVVEPRGAHCFFYSHNRSDGELHGI